MSLFLLDGEGRYVNELLQPNDYSYLKTTTYLTYIWPNYYTVKKDGHQLSREYRAMKVYGRKSRAGEGWLVRCCAVAVVAVREVGGGVSSKEKGSIFH